jgi:hypothetical protein
MLSLAGCGGSERGTVSDADNDGVADSVDCAPQLAQAWRLLDFASIDQDEDGFRVNASGQVCAGGALPPNRFATSVSADSMDCDDSDATIWSTRIYAAVDTDHDGYGVAKSGEVCAGAALPAGLIAMLPAAADLDCDDADPYKWHRSDFASRDRDGDGYGIAEAGIWCGQGTLPAGMSANSTPPQLVDCDDTDASRWRFMAIYRDADGDGIGGGSASRECIGNVPRDGYRLTGYDPLDDPNDPLALSTSTFDLDSALLTVPEDVAVGDIF